MKKTVFKKFVSVLTIMTVMLSCSLVGNVSASETINVSGGSSAYTSTKSLSGVHTVYSVDVLNFKFYKNPKNSMPSGGHIKTRIHTSSGVAAGDQASFTSRLQAQNPSYWSGHGYAGSYKLKCESDLSLAFWVELSWNP
jgi:hypothetical protein